jgi:geranylgeranylglycerol-phosphate geranylgeranyltransferase
MLSHLLAAIEISRPHNMLAAGLCVAAGCHVAGGELGTAAIAAAALAALATGAGNVINDYFDLEIDRVNKPRRPLPSNRISKRGALVTYVFLSIAVLAGALLFVPRQVTALVLVWQVALFGYAVGAQRVFVAGNLLVAVITSSAFVAGGLAAGNARAALVPFLIAFFFVLCRELVKGAEDIRGDAGAGVRTLALVLGVERTVVVASVMMLALASLIPLPAIVGYYGEAYFWTMVLGVVPGLVVGARMITARARRQTFTRVSWILKAGMFLGILAIAMGNM